MFFLIVAILTQSTNLTFRVSKTMFIDVPVDVFARCSLKFERQGRASQQIDLRHSWIDEYSATQWVKACQGENYEISDANPIAMLELCDEWEAERVAAGIQAKIRMFLHNDQIEADLRLQLHRTYQNWEQQREKDRIAREEMTALRGEVAELRRQLESLRNESQGRLVIAPRSEFDQGGVVFHLRLHKCRGQSAQGSWVLFSTACGLWQPSFVVANLEANTAGSFITDNGPNRFFVLQFLHNIEVTPTHYMLKTRHEADANHPRNWKLEGSMDGVNWTIIDVKDNNIMLTGSRFTFVFTVKNTVRCRFLKFTQTGLDSSNWQHLCLSGFDVFGEVRNLEQE
jgi:polyhydroxyalkanoate synthesis regulator phasin